MIQWPATLPQAPFRQYSHALAAGLSSESDELSQRRTRTYPESEVEFQFKQLTTPQLQALRSFYDVDLNQTAPFSSPWLPSAGFTHHFCQFTAPPEAKRNGLRWDVSVSLLIIAGVPTDSEGNITYGAA